jgi:hypothetical protein
MNRFLTAATLTVALSSTAFADGMPLPPRRPANIVQANYVQTFQYQKVLPNGVVRQCRVERHMEQHRGLVNTTTCWRAR